MVSGCPMAMAASRSLSRSASLVFYPFKSKTLGKINNAYTVYKIISDDKSKQNKPQNNK